jgi:hypothetical protein
VGAAKSGFWTKKDKKGRVVSLFLLRLSAEGDVGDEETDRLLDTVLAAYGRGATFSSSRRAHAATDGVFYWGPKRAYAALFSF